MEDRNQLDPRTIARTKMWARRSRITEVRKRIGVLAAVLAIAFTGSVAALGTTGSSFANGPGSGAANLSRTSVESPTVATTDGPASRPYYDPYAQPQSYSQSYDQQYYYQPPTSAPVQTAQS